MSNFDFILAKLLIKPSQLPNILSFFRLFASPVFYVQLVSRNILAFPVFLLVVASDLLDGKVARHFECTSIKGKIFDASADFFILITGFSYYFMEGRLSPILLVVMVISLFQYLLTIKLTVSDLLGKYVGTVLYILLAALMLFPRVEMGFVVSVFGVGYIVTSLLSRLYLIFS
jgi:phosphatidylglycerophosphate synthase